MAPNLSVSPISEIGFLRESAHSVFSLEEDVSIHIYVYLCTLYFHITQSMSTGRLPSNHRI